eukprot:g9544.t1
MAGLDQGNPEEPFASGNIAQVLRQARASLKDPSRPFTPTERRLRSTKSLFGEAGFPPAVGSSNNKPEIDFVLDAIDNEVDLSGDCFGFGADADSDGSPDPGALEGRRERNARLSGLLRMLSRNLESGAENCKPTFMDGGASSPAAAEVGDRCAGGIRTSPSLSVDDGTGGTHKERSSVRTWRTLEVLSRVMRRQRGPADASPPSITELPGLLAARMVIGLVLTPLPQAPRRPGSGGRSDGCHRADSSTPAGSRIDNSGGEEQRPQQQRRHQLLLFLGRACRHLFEVSKKAGADEAFFSSGTVKGLLEFVESAASDLGSTAPGAGFPGIIGTEQGQRATRRGLCAEEAAQSPGGDDADLSDTTATTKSSSRYSINASCMHASENDLPCYDGGEHVQSVCDSLTFAIGCLKNVSADEGLQDRLVEAGSIRKLCGLVRSTRDLCHRCDGECEPRKQEGREGSCREPLAMSLLRDLAAGGKDRSNAFRGAGAVRTLCSIFPSFRGYQDVVLNAARALAKLSLHEKTRADINSNPAHVRDLLAALVEQGREIDSRFRDLEENCRDSSPSSASSYFRSTAARGGPVAAAAAERRRHWEKQGKRIATCVRIAFALGNLTSASDENRRLIGVRLGGAESLPALLASSSRAHLAAWESLRSVEDDPDPVDFADRSADGGSSSSSSNANESACKSGYTRGGQAASFREESWSRRTLRRACDGLEEMLVKTVRLLANISIHREVGQRVCRHPGLAALEPLIGTCLELFELFEDGALPGADPGIRQGTKSGVAPTEEALMVPGEELLLNVVSLVTNLSFYGPELKDGRVAPADLAPSGSACEGSSSSSKNNNSSSSSAAESPASATTPGPPHASTLFALASKARREVEEPDFRAGSVAGDNYNPRSEGDVAGDKVLTTKSRSCRPAGGTEGGKNGGGRRRREVLCGHLVKVLLHPNAEAVAEAARAFGNFSRDRSCREAMHQRRADEVLVALLGHQSREVVFAAAGALVNVAADRACKALLSRESVGAGERLARLVRRAGLADPSLAELACQALHNLLIAPLPQGGAEEVLGGSDTCQRLWWTLKELMEACSSFEGQGAEDDLREGNAGAFRGRESWELGGFQAAAAAVWGVLNQGRVDYTPPYEEL